MIRSVVAPEKKSNQLQMNYEEYLIWSRTYEGRTEWVDGEVVVHMSVKPVHQEIVNFLFVLLNLFVRLHKLGRVTTAPVEVKLTPRISREPDIFFIATDLLAQLTDTRFEGAPTLAIEVISGESVRRDRETKYKEYQNAGVQEYWIIDSREGKQRADFYRLNEKGEYVLVGTEDDERFESAVLPNFWLDPNWLWQVGEVEPFLKFLEIAAMPVDEIVKKLEG